MALKTYGELVYKQVEKKVKGKIVQQNVFSIETAQPHVCIKLKAIFTQIGQTHTVPFHFPDTPEYCHKLLWFMELYPMTVSDSDMERLQSGKRKRIEDLDEIERLFLPDYKSLPAILNEGETARHYQLTGRDMFMKVKRMLLTDDLGLGKTLTAILCALETGCRPAAIVVQTHLPKQWSDEIKKFTGLTVHIVKTRKAYNLPPADIYIFKYTSLSGWVDLFGSGFFKYACFDEVQELRHPDTDKYKAAEKLSINAEYVIGLSATPIYNYGNEIFSILNCINPDCLGDINSFNREWTSNGKVVSNPTALGTYLRENLLVLRRTREEVGMELPPVNRIVQTVAHDEDIMDKDLALAKQLAIQVTTGAYFEKGQAAVQLDALVRHATGVSKARSVAAFVRILCESGEKVVLSAWHREVYDILLEELKEFNPVMYTGSESPTQKQKSKEAFIYGDAQIFMLSLRSGAGLDGLQIACKYVVFGELDWSPAVMNQVIGRLDRFGSENQVTAIFLVSEAGSDPLVVDKLALKSSQQHGIVNPLIAVPEQYSDKSMVKLLAEQYLAKK